jgi:alkylated DNA repair dioxygenase AlkB
MVATAPLQRSLLTLAPPDGPIVREATPWERVLLDDGAWIDVARGWLAGADDVLDHVVTTVCWQGGRRWMYERMVDDPRLHFRYTDRVDAPHPVLADARRILEGRYGVLLSPLGLNYYRDGNDSVAFHRDRELREVDDSLVVILTLGARRRFLVRAQEGSPRRSTDLAPASGDVVVMGGGCQARWEHSVPKVRGCGPRVAATWRWCRSADDAPSPPVTNARRR